VGAQEFIHNRLVAERDQGTAVIIVSTELDEVLTLADRILVMYRGKIIGELPGGASRDQVGLMMAGVPAEQARQEAVEKPSTMAALDSEVDEARPPSRPPPPPNRSSPSARSRRAAGKASSSRSSRSCWRCSSAGS
jgi:simple sugar transport system ATP-binding protein